MTLRLPSLAPFRHGDFTRFWAMRACGTLAVQIQATTLGWQVYELARDAGRSVTESAFLLGVVGLLQFLPLLVLSPFGGQAADRWNRKAILLAYHFVKAATALWLVSSAAFGDESAIVAVFAAAVVVGAINAFAPSASQAMLPTLLPREELPQAIALSSLAFSTASVVGPAVAGAAIALGETAGGLGAQFAYGLTVLFCLAAFILCLTIRPPAQTPIADAKAVTLILEGLAYTWRNKIVLGAISLDLVAVLLAGATALLPVYARDILHVGPDGLGLMRAAPAAGAALVAIVLAATPLRRRVGQWMFASVGVFGVSTLAFGVSEIFWLSLSLLVIIGASDMVSVYVRSALIQLSTPDNMRGRVSATSFIFISASNELGEFQSGVFARLFGPVGAVVVGGIGAVACAGLWIKLFPALWRMNRFEDATAYGEALAETPLHRPV
jgi:MFS family permease